MRLFKKLKGVTIMSQSYDFKKKLKDNEERREQALTRKRANEMAISKHEQKAANMVGALLEQERLASLRENELIKSKLDRLSEKQHQNNVEMRALSHSLSDLSDLEAVYARKRTLMEQNYQELKKMRQADELLLTERNKELIKQNKKKKEALDKLSEEYDALSLNFEMKKRSHQFVVSVLVVFVGIVLGSILGIPFVDFFRKIFEGIKELF